MKTARPVPADTSSGRRAQPVRQTRTNPPRAYSGLGRSFGAKDAPGRGPANDDEEQTEIYPAITHFADAVTALPRELVRHFTLLKEVDAKVFAPEEALGQLVDAALNYPLPERRQKSDRQQLSASTSIHGSVYTSHNGSMVNGHNSQPDAIDNYDRATAVYDAANLPRRQLFRQSAYTMQEMLVSLDEKNHVISTATEALDKHMARLNDCLPYVEAEFSEEAKFGSTRHWAYSENRVSKPNERSRRENANVNHLTNAAAAAAAEEAAARSEARKQAMLAKKNRAQHVDSDFDDHHDHRKGESKRPHGNTKKGRPAENSNSAATTNNAGAHGNPPPKRRKVDKGPNGGAVMERSLSAVYGANGTALKGKGNSPRETPVPDPRKRTKAAATTNGQPRKRTAAINATTMSPNIASSPVQPPFHDPKTTHRASPPPANGRPTTTRARQNSTQSAVDHARQRPTSSASNKPNGAHHAPPDLALAAALTGRPVPDLKASIKESATTAKHEHLLEAADPASPALRGALLAGSRGGAALKAEDSTDTNGDAASSAVVAATPQAAVITTKSGRASKPSTPALPIAAFAEPAAGGRASTARRSALEAAGANKRSHKKGAGQAAQQQQQAQHQQAQQQMMAAAQAQAQAQARAREAEEEDAGEQAEEEEEVPEPDADELRYCYCNGVSYGEMVACDAEGCAKEWFHLECVGLRVAPKGNAKWFCDECKERLKGRRFNAR